jgi:hypothetical protein
MFEEFKFVSVNNSGSIFTLQSFKPHYDLRVYLDSNRNEYQESSWG